MDKVINWPLLSNPVNWIIVVLMVLIAGIFINVIQTAGSTASNTGS